MDMQLREIEKDELGQLLQLYTFLHEEAPPREGEELQEVWESILADPRHHILVGCVGERLICSCVLLIVPNLTHGLQPYALIENVVTHKDFRGKGCGTALLAYAVELAQTQNCYKIMLMTGRKDEKTLRFYERAGFNRQDKTAFVRRV